MQWTRGESRVPFGAAAQMLQWLSSARAVRCSVKSGNERNPCRQLPSSKVGDSGGTARVKREEGADDVKSVWLLHLGPQTCYNGRYKWASRPRAERTPKTCPSSDCSLQLGCMKSESLVKGHQLRSLEYVPGPCTHRPSHHGSRTAPKAAGLTRKGGRRQRCVWRLG